MHVAIFKHGKP